MECQAVEENCVRQSGSCSRNPHKNNISNHLMNINNIIDINSPHYEKYLCIGDFNSGISETVLRNLYKRKNLISEPTCFKNPDNP